MGAVVRDSLDYAERLNLQLGYLFAFARRCNELDTVAAAFGEFRGMQGPGWNTMATAHEVAAELQALGNAGRTLNRPEVRQVLCLYTQLSEAGGVYEGLLNVLGAVQLKAYNLWPFQSLVRVRKKPQAIIGPNANAMFRKLAEEAAGIGMKGLSQLLEETFRDDIRNAIAHADYVLVDDGLRIRRRNGGNPIHLTMAEINTALQTALFFFQILTAAQREVAMSFRPGREVIGRFSANPPMPWRVEFTSDGHLSISTSSPGAQTNDAYLRQQRINIHLGGRVVCAFSEPGQDFSSDLLAEILELGFEVQIIDFPDREQMTKLVSEIDEYGLWDGPKPDEPEASRLMATPMGFRRIASSADFQAWLPVVEPLEIVEPNIGTRSG